MNTLDHLAELLAKAPAFPEALQPEEEGSYRCPVCDGDGTVDAEWIAHARSNSWAGGVQFYGLGHEHGWAEEFYLAARTYLPALLEIARAAKRLDDNLCDAGDNYMVLSADAERQHDALAKLPKETP